MQYRWSLMAVMAAGAVALAGCSSDADSSAAPTSAPTAAPATSAPPTTAPPQGKDRLRHGVAVPGATFALHTAVGIRFHSGTKSGVLRLKIGRITRGRPKDLKPLRLGHKVDGMYPYYIRFAAKNLTRANLSRAWVKDLVGVDDQGNEVRHVQVIGSFPKCPPTRAPRGFTKGRLMRGCSLAVAPPDTRVAGARWRGVPYGPTTDKAITWKD